MTLICAHRGDPTHAPESTVAAFRLAAELEVEMAEFDVHRTVDGELVVMHDATVDRCTDGTGKIAEMTLEQIRSLDAGSRFSPEFAGERVPTLTEAIQALPAPIWLNIHLKTVDHSGALGFEDRFMEELAASGAAGRAHIVHDYLESLDRIRTITPRMPCCWLPMCEDGMEYIRRSKAAGFGILQPGRNMMSAEFCRAVKEAGMTANVFYANAEADMRLYMDFGIDGILTDDPRRMKEVRGR